jgi:CubicO group peptidase (beta-lactamase class C family)
MQAALDARAAGAPGTGIAVGVIDRGHTKIYVAGSTGNGRAVDQRTLFEIGSVTKTFTATILSVMSRAGEVRLGDPISKYLPAGTHAPSRSGKQITLLDLAEQRSGLPRLPANMDAGANDPYADYTNADMYAFLNGYALDSEPGTAYGYSNYGLGLLGQLLANRAGTTYPRLLGATVLQPLAMDRTVLVMSGTPTPPLLAVGHDLGGNPVTTWQFQSIAPAGAMASNLDDMLKYLRCNMGLGPLAADCLFAQQPRAAGQPRHKIGLVWNVNQENGIISHGGDTDGSHAFVAISRDHRTGVVAMSNGPFIADIATRVVLPGYPVGTCPASASAAEADPASYAGVYCNAGSGLTFVVRNTPKTDVLSIALLPQPAANVPRVTSDTFESARYGASFQFVREGARIVGLWLRQYGQTIPAVRLDARGKPLVAQLASAFPPVVTLTPAELQQYVGTYTAKGLGSFTVTLQGDTLDVQLTGQPAAPVFPSGKDEFFYKVVDAQITFNRDAAGNVASLVLHQNGQTVSAFRGVPPASAFPPSVSLTPAQLQEYAGTYTANSVGTFTVALHGDTLDVQLTGQPAAPVFPSAKDEFFYKLVDAQITFGRDAAGNITSLTLHQNGQTVTARKTP